MFEADLFCRKKLLILVSLSYCLFWIWYFKLYWMLTEFFASMDTILFEYYELKHIKQRAIVCCINSNILQNIRHSTAWIMSTRAHQYFLPWTAVIGLIDGSYSNWCICSWWNIDHRLRDLYFLQMMMHRDFHFLLFPAVVFDTDPGYMLMLLIGRWHSMTSLGSSCFFILIPCEFCDGLGNI